MELVLPIGRHSLAFCWESSIMQGNGAHWRKVAATIWRHPQFLPILFDICSQVRIFSIPANVIIVSIVFIYRTRDAFIPCNGSRCTVNECRRDAARWGGLTCKMLLAKCTLAYIFRYICNDALSIHIFCFVKMNLLWSGLFISLLEWVLRGQNMS